MGRGVGFALSPALPREEMVSRCWLALVLARRLFLLFQSSLSSSVDGKMNEMQGVHRNGSE